MPRKLIVIFLSFVILNASTEIHQLWKLPFLIQHYFHHQKEKPTLSFITFLKIHYTNKDHPDDNDDKDDNALPFKSVSNISHTDLPVLEKKNTVEEYFYFLQRPSAYFPEGFPQHRAYAIFHPPRMA